ncbi:redox-sensing transcriptional repressor Rex [Christensenellaceae bacterium OttesenSCG-928-K19]|nr:redox-sensing transcriptional repressor Rex [Christensenellaceae bacterium OttesenSCG-928-K19]
MKIVKQPDGVVRRLPRYYRYLADLNQMGISRVSSKDLSARIGNTPSQVRQDFNCFGGFGQQGYGYDVDTLYKAIADILGLNETNNMIIMGAGRLGQALANYTYFEKKGFKLTGIFDVRSSVIGKQIRGVDIRHINELESFVHDNPVDIAALAVPKDQINDVADAVARLGIKGIWNFTPMELKVEDHIIVENIQLSDSLMTLGYRLKEAAEDPKV